MKKNKEKDYIYVVSIDQGNDFDRCSLILTRQTKDEKVVVLEEYGEKAMIWLDFFFKLHSGNAKVVVEKDKQYVFISKIKI